MIEDKVTEAAQLHNKLEVLEQALDNACGVLEQQVPYVHYHNRYGLERGTKAEWKSWCLKEEYK